MSIYRDHIARLLSSTGDRAYEEAINYLEKIEALMKRVKKADMFAAIVRERMRR